MTLFADALAAAVREGHPLPVAASRAAQAAGLGRDPTLPEVMRAVASRPEAFPNVTPNYPRLVR